MPQDRQPRVQRIVRVRTGCWSCRRRKKKCDEVRPICGGCVRNSLNCQWPSTVSGRRGSRPTDEGPVLEADERSSDLPQCGEEDDAIEIPYTPVSRRQSSLSSNSERFVEIGDALNDLAEDARRASITSSSDGALMGSMAVGNVMPRNLSLLPGYDPESYQLLNHYLATTADCMANGSTPINPFLVQIVPLAFTSDLLLQLVLTQSAAHRAFRWGNETDTIAHSHYTKALQRFRGGVTDFIEGKESNPLMLLVGALVMCFTETARGDMNGTIFDHLSAAHSLLVKLLEQSDAAVPRELKDFVIEYYIYTATVSMISINARFSRELFLNIDLEQRAHQMSRSQYVGNLCGCWLELLLLIPCIFDLGRQWRLEDAQTITPTADDLAMFASLQAQILRWSPYLSVGPEVHLAGLIFQKAMLIYLYTATEGFGHTPDGMYQGLIDTAVTEAMVYLDELSPTVRINSGLCWPISVVGSCLSLPEQQDRLRRRQNVMVDTFGLGNMQRTLLLLEAMWQLPASEAGPWNICQTMQQNHIWISFA